MYPGTDVHGDHSEVPKGAKGAPDGLLGPASITPQEPAGLKAVLHFEYAQF